MSSFSRRFILLGLAACGFAAAYGPGGSATRLQDAVLLEAPDSRTGYLLTRHIEDRLGRGGRQVYGLSGQAESFTSYPASGTTVATQAAKRDAQARLMVILADQTLNRLTAEAGKLPA